MLVQIITHENANVFDAETIPNDSNGNPVLVKTPGFLQWTMPNNVTPGYTLNTIRIRFTLTMITAAMAAASIVTIQPSINNVVIDDILLTIVLPINADAGWYMISGEFPIGDITMPTPASRTIICSYCY